MESHMCYNVRSVKRTERYMDNLLLSFNVVAPLVVYMAVGFALRRLGVICEKTCSEISQIIFCVLLPALCCDNLRVLDYSRVLGDPFVPYTVAAVLLLFVLSMAVVPRLCRDNARRGALVQGVFRSNDGIFGLAVGTALLLPEQVPVIVLCISVTIPVYNILAVAEMEYFRGGRLNLGRILLRIVTNPVILGCAAGALLSLLSVKLPVFIAKPLSVMSSMCAPLGFIALGGALTFDSLRENRRAIAALSLVKLLIVPGLLLAAFYFMGYRDAELLTVLVIFGAPSAMSIYPMSCSMGGDEKLAAGIVAVTSVLSLPTMFLFIFILKELGVA